MWGMQELFGFRDDRRAKLMVVLSGACSNDRLPASTLPYRQNTVTQGNWDLRAAFFTGLMIFPNLDKPWPITLRIGCSYPDRFSCKRKWCQSLPPSCTYPDFVQAIVVAIIDEHQPFILEIRFHQHRPSLHYHVFISVACRQQISLASGGLYRVFTCREHCSAHHKIKRNSYGQI